MPPLIGFMPAMTSPGRACLYSSFFELVNLKIRLADPGAYGDAHSEGIFRPETARNDVSSDLDRASREAPPGAAIGGFGLVWWFRSSLHYRRPVRQENF
jgi:hypothetical protein